MPTLDWNQTVWDGQYAWPQAGDEWSHAWGSAEAQWFGSLWPRLHPFFPAARVLEIAPGYGRWTRFLLRQTLCGYWGVDLSLACVQHCQQRFPRRLVPASFHHTDGRSLAMVPVGAIDVVFSFDSLVHADQAVLEAYVPQILQCLTPQGVAFLHHSNWAAVGQGPVNPYGRDASVSAQTVAQAVAAAGGRMLLQECLTWGHCAVSDCLSLFCRPAAAWCSPVRHIDSPDFMQEARLIRQSQSPWSQLRGPARL